MSVARRRLLPWVGLAGVVLCYQALALASPFPEGYLPSVPAILEALADQVQTGEFWKRLWETVQTFALGLALAAIGLRVARPPLSPTPPRAR